MSIRNVLLPAALVLLAGCSGTTTSTASEKSVGFDANAPKSSCCHKDGAGDCAGKSDCAGKADCTSGKSCDKDATAPATNG